MPTVGSPSTALPSKHSRRPPSCQRSPNNPSQAHSECPLRRPYPYLSSPTSTGVTTGDHPQYPSLRLRLFPTAVSPARVLPLAAMAPSKCTRGTKFSATYRPRSLPAMPPRPCAIRTSGYDHLDNPRETPTLRCVSVKEVPMSTTKGLCTSRQPDSLAPSLMCCRLSPFL
jgi:hypothetical protein